MNQDEESYTNVDERQSNLDSYFEGVSSTNKLLGFVVSAIIGLLIISWSYSLLFSSATLGSAIAFIFLNLFAISCLSVSTMFLTKPSDQKALFKNSRMRVVSFYLFLISTVALYIDAILVPASLKILLSVFFIVGQLVGFVGYSLTYSPFGQHVEERLTFLKEDKKDDYLDED